MCIIQNAYSECCTPPDKKMSEICSKSTGALDHYNLTYRLSISVCVILIRILVTIYPLRPSSSIHFIFLINAPQWKETCHFQSSLNSGIKPMLAFHCLEFMQWKHLTSIWFCLSHALTGLSNGSFNKGSCDTCEMILFLLVKLIKQIWYFKTCLNTTMDVEQTVPHIHLPVCDVVG